MERTARQLRADDTRARLFTAAAELFVELGYHSATIEQIAKRAGVAKGTFFVHFASKDAVILELVRIQCSGARRARQKALESGASRLDALRSTVIDLGTRAGASRNISRAVLAAGLEDPAVGDAVSKIFDEVLADMIEDARHAARDGLLKAETDPEQLATQLMVSYLGSALHFTSTPRARPLVEVLEPLVDNSLSLARSSARAAENRHAQSSSRPRSSRRRV